MIVKPSFSPENITRVPVHVAIIMDGNGRWAQQRGLPRLEGHRAGVENAKAVVDGLNRHGVGCVTLYAFSTENWSRPRDEVVSLERLMGEAVTRELRQLHERGIRIRHLGRLDGLAADTRRAIEDAVALTRDNSGMTVNFAFNYGGRQEIVDAVRKLAAAAVPPERIDEQLLGEHLYTAGLPDVDLVIRTGGEIRTSNFLLWQSAYSEYYFTPVLWPDFNEAELAGALAAFSRRERRFGSLTQPGTPQP